MGIKKAASNKIINLLGAAFIFVFFSNLAFAGGTYPSLSVYIDPSSGASQPNQGITFTCTYTSRNGYQYLTECKFMVNTSYSNSANCFLGYYDAVSNKLYLMNDSGSAWLTDSYIPGSRGPNGQDNILKNSFAELNCSKTTVTKSGQNITISWAVTFNSTFLGQKNLYLFAKDKYGSSIGWLNKGTWTIGELVLSISVNPKLWDIGSTGVNQTVTMTSGNKITVTNDGSGPETFTLSLINPPGWAPSTTPGENIYVLSGIFCNSTDTPQPNQFNQDGSTEDIITSQSKIATQTIFGYGQSTANGASVSSGNSRSLYLQFKSPTITDKQTEQNMSVIISCQTS